MNRKCDNPCKAFAQCLLLWCYCYYYYYFLAPVSLLQEVCLDHSFSAREKEVSFSALTDLSLMISYVTLVF